MTPKEKANQLVNKFSSYVPTKISYLEFGGDDNDFKTIVIESKKCALIAVDEILNITCLKDLDLDYNKYYNDKSEFKNYWIEVKQEIEKL